MKKKTYTIPTVELVTLDEALMQDNYSVREKDYNGNGSSNVSEKSGSESKFNDGFSLWEDVD